MSSSMTNTAVRGIDPRTGATVGEYPASTADEYERVLARARECAMDPQMQVSSLRANGLRRGAARIRNRGDEIVATAGLETGLPDGRLRGELERTCLQLELFAEVIDAGEHLEPMIDRADPDARPAPRPDLRRQLVPIGPVAVFGASNFPLAFSTAGGDTASALAAGCPVVFKGHPAHPGTATLVADELLGGLTEAGLPAGAFSQLLSADASVGEQLVEDPRVCAIAFTGSFEVGIAISRRAAQRERPIPVFAEMGSLNPLVVTPAAAAARRGQIADGLAASVATFGGQLCTKPGLALISDDPAGHALVQDLAAALAARGPEVLLTQTIHRRFQEGVHDLANASEVEHAVGNREPDAAGSASSRPHLFTAPLDALDRVTAIREEHFGPALVVLFYQNLDSAAEALEKLGGQLTISLHSQPEEHALLGEFVSRMTRLCGRLVFDGYPTGVAVCWSMEHGGPYPATSAESTTSVGVTALRRFQRPVVLQNAAEAFIPPALADANPDRLRRRIDGQMHEA